MGGVEHVDVDRHVHRTRPQPPPHLLCDVLGGAVLEPLAADDLEARSLVVLQTARPLDAAADADVLAMIQVEEPLLFGPTERRAVPERGPAQHVPGVQMGVEVQHSHGAVSGSRGAQQSRAIVWSPPSARIRLPEEVSVWALDWIVSTARAMSYGPTPM